MRVKNKVLTVFTILAIVGVFINASIVAADAHELTAIVSDDANYKTRVRVFHASPDAPNVDVWVNETKAFSDIAFQEYTEYAELDYGNWNITVVEAGTTSPAVIGPVVLNLGANTDYTIAAVNQLSSIEPIVLIDDNSPVGADNARVRVVHASYDAPNVDVAVQGGPILLANVSFKEVGTVEVPAGTYDLEVNVTETNTQVLNLTGTALAGGEIYTVFATDVAANLTEIITIDANADARVRVVHASPDAPGVDVWVNGTKAFENIVYKEITGYAELPFGSWNISVVATGTTSPAVIGPVVLNLVNDTDYTIVALNTLENIEPLVLVDDNTPVAVDKSRLRFVHASPDAPAVDINVAGGPTLFSNIAFKGVGDYILVNAATYDLQVNATGTDTLALDLPGVDISASAVYTAYAVGFATTTPATTPGLSLWSIGFFLMIPIVLGVAVILKKRR